jgi:hypothetical protein
MPQFLTYIKVTLEIGRRRRDVYIEITTRRRLLPSHTADIRNRTNGMDRRVGSALAGVERRAYGKEVLVGICTYAPFQNSHTSSYSCTGCPSLYNSP